MTQLTGKSIIGFKRVEGTGESVKGFDPASGATLEPTYRGASADDVNRAVELAHVAFGSFSRSSGKERARFLNRIAENIEELVESVVERATKETGLPEGRIRSETGRTCNQLRLFAELVSEGSWVDARIDHADLARKPLPKPDVRSILRPLGPVVVFGASNFPLAFSVAGGDTASALAGGNPVIVKAHHAHPGTSELIGNAITEAAQQCDLSEGVFSLLYGSGTEVGMALVKHPLVKAGGFTGSRAGGRALFDAASSRPEPIPFYAEMSSVNPVVILPGAIRERGEQVAAGLHGSVILGAGQFCTNPGLVFLKESEESQPFIEKLATLINSTANQTMLTSGISSNYQRAVAERARELGVSCLAHGAAAPGTCQAHTALFRTDANTFLANQHLSEEIFGPSTLLILYADDEQLMELVESLEGQLTGSVIATEEELNSATSWINVLERKVGRLLFNNFPTGVEVCHAMVHGGPYPATSDGRSTSVGTRAIFRFTRQVCFQNFPDSALPEELKDSNPLNIWRLVDGEMRK